MPYTFSNNIAKFTTKSAWDSADLAWDTTTDLATT
jgi:hypothetical protein